MTSAWQNDNYHGLQEVPFGALMELEFVKNKRGVIHLRRATIKRIDVFRDYKLKIEFNFDIKQFFSGIDKEITFDMTA